MVRHRPWIGTPGPAQLSSGGPKVVLMLPLREMHGHRSPIPPPQLFYQQHAWPSAVGACTRTSGTLLHSTSCIPDRGRRPARRFNSVPPEAALPVMMELMMVLPQEVDSRKICIRPERRRNFEQELINSFEDALGILSRSVGPPSPAPRCALPSRPALHRFEQQRVRPTACHGEPVCEVCCAGCDNSLASMPCTVAALLLALNADLSGIFRPCSAVRLLPRPVLVMIPQL